MIRILTIDMSRKPYSLIPEELPRAGVARRASIYDELLDDYMKGSAKSARLEYSSKSTNALMAGLRSRIRTRGLNIRVVFRKGKLYLTKT